MALWNVSGRVVNDADEGVRIPEHALRLPEYNLSYQYDQPVQWESWQGGDTPQGVQRSAPGYIPQLLAWADASEAGTLKPYERAAWEELQSQARAVPLRDVSGAYGGWGAKPDDPTGQRLLNVNSPDIGTFMLTVREKMKNGTATPQERSLFQETARTAADWDFRASVPQESDANPFGMGDQLFGALFTLGLGATGGLAAAPLLAGGASLGTTLGSLGTLAGTAGSIGNLVAPAIDQDWWSRLTQGLGAAGGIAGGVGGLANLWGTGIQGLGDAARLASNAGRVVGGVGGLADSDWLRQGAGYLSAAGGLGSGAETLSTMLGSGVTDLTDAARLARGLGQVGGAVGQVTGNRPLGQAAGVLGLGGRLGSGVQGLLGAAGQAQQRGTAPVPRTMNDTDWLRWQGNQGPWHQNATPVLWNL